MKSDTINCTTKNWEYFNVFYIRWTTILKTWNAELSSGQTEMSIFPQCCGTHIHNKMQAARTEDRVMAA
jgi:hypothetical protein